MVESLFVVARADWHLWPLKIDEDDVCQNRRYIYTTFSWSCRLT